MFNVASVMHTILSPNNNGGNILSAIHIKPSSIYMGNRSNSTSYEEQWRDFDHDNIGENILS